MRKLILMITVLGLCLCACATVGETRLPTETTQETTAATEAPELLVPEEYDALLQELVEAFPATDTLSRYPELTHMYTGHTSLTELGWALEDLDGDGSPELLIKSLESPFIYDAFTVKDGVLTDLFSSTENDSFRLYEEGYVEAQWSAGTAMGTDHYRLEAGELKLLERVAMDPEQAATLGLVEEAANADPTACWFRSATGEKGDYTSVTAADALKIQQSFKEDHFELYPVFTPLSDYKNS